VRTEQLAGARLPRLADEVEATGEPVVLVRDGHQDLMLVPAGDVAAYRAWMSHLETAELAGDPAAQREIAQARAEYARGEFTTGEDARARYGLPPLDAAR
jgi:PHD/YefM family antitoxin component YafN of YafNO toxin-antitoxin module